MDGIFLRKKFNSWLFLLLVCGLFLIGLYIFLNIADSEVTDGSLTFLIMGILICLVVIPSWLLNYGAFIRIDEDSIKAKYHWFGKIDCKLSDVDFASAGTNTLNIQLKNGKCHTIMGIANSLELSSVIRRKMSFDVTEQPKTLIEKLNNLISARKRDIIYVCSGVAMMFINLFITAFLTGERELYEFSKIDWIIFVVMGVIEFATIVATFCFAHKAGKNNVTIEKLQYAIKRTIIETESVLPGNVVGVYTDENYYGRITVFGYPNAENVYYVTEKIYPDYSLHDTYTSEVFDDIEYIQNGLESLIDITDKSK